MVDFVKIMTDQTPIIKIYRQLNSLAETIRHYQKSSSIHVINGICSLHPLLNLSIICPFLGKCLNLAYYYKRKARSCSLKVTKVN